MSNSKMARNISFIDNKLFLNLLKNPNPNTIFSEETESFTTTTKQLGYTYTYTDAFHKNYISVQRKINPINPMINNSNNNQVNNSNNNQVNNSNNINNINNNQVNNKSNINGNNTNSNSNNKTEKSFYYVNAKDQLFWCFLMILNSWEENDLPELNERFTYENKEKMGLTELLRKSSTIPWRELKITKTSVYSNLSESINGKVNVDVLKALAFLCEKNIIYKCGKCYIDIPGGRAYEKADWHVIEKTRSGHRLATDTYAKKLYDEVKQEKYYEIKDINKPLLSISSYKAEELYDIAKKFDIVTTRENGKFKLKKDIYNEIVEIIHKID
jgi:hypothetical protein